VLALGMLLLLVAVAVAAQMRGVRGALLRSRMASRTAWARWVWRMAYIESQ
jgi:hypothetical protein